MAVEERTVCGYRLSVTTKHIPFENAIGGMVQRTLQYELQI